MVTQLSQHVAGQVKNLLTWLKGYEESGIIGIDCISFQTRDLLKEHGII